MNITASRFKVIVSCEVFNILSERILPPGQGEVAQSVVLLKLAAHWPDLTRLDRLELVLLGRKRQCVKL